MARLFFAIWPDDEARRELALLAARAAADSGGRATPPEKLHATLAFLGEVAPDRQALALQAGMRLRAKPFELLLDRTGMFRRAGVAWAGCAQAPAALVNLQRRLAERLAASGFLLDERPYAPHITLARRIRRPSVPPLAAAIAWRVRAYTLVRTEPGTGRYVIEREWELRG